ncbi:hypothetical protein Ahy_A01g004111 [Arachis hypogaea]|uniref:FAR1 domain-containing protein n=1 Tax=Arachis hypogaea TaxID=3818 RepID=A0A445EUU6_ARAHY|nr:hypothetical protein Ahy_A01g004111 [Arachis hypogaea]
MMDDSTSDSQVNQSKMDFETKSNKVLQTSCPVDDKFVSKVGMTFKTLDEAEKFYKDYSKVADQAQMLKQHRELSMSMCCTIENNEEAGIKPSKNFQSFVAAAGGHCELNFIEKDVRNYITREVRNVSE